MHITIDPKDAKRASEKIISEYGGKVCDWLPYLDRASLRSIEEVVGRALVLNALINIHFEAPTKVIKDWIETHNLSAHLTDREKDILNRDNSLLTEQELTNLYWYIESLWALMWATTIIDEMPFDKGIADDMISFCPDLENDEGPEKFTKNMVLRSANDIFKELDLYYRLHWWTRDGSLKGYSTGNVSLDIIMERRKALEWLFSPNIDWDNFPDDT